MNIIDHFVQLLILGLTVIPMVFGWIVFGFFLAKFFFKGEGRKKWTPKQLPLVPKKEETQQRRDAMIAMTLFFLLAMLIILSRDYIGVWIFDDGQFKQTITFLQANMPIPTLLYIVIILGLLITKEISKLIFKNNIKQAVFATMINLISTGIIIYLTLHKALWNQKFMSSFVDLGLLTKNSDKYSVIQTIWEQFTFWIIVLFILGLCIDSVREFFNNSRNITR